MPTVPLPPPYSTPDPYEPDAAKSGESISARVITTMRQSQDGGEQMDAMLALTEQMVELAPMGMVVLDIVTLQVRLANRMARQLYSRASGAPGDRLIGQRVDLLLPWLEERGLVAQLQVAARTGEALRELTLDHISVPGRVGATYWRYDIVPLSEVAQPTRDVLVVINDYTQEHVERQRAEHATFSAQLYAEKLEAVIEQIGEAVIVRDQQGRMLAYNRAALSYACNRRAVERARARGGRQEPRWELCYPDGMSVAERERPSWQALLAGTPVSTDQYCIRQENGVMLPVLIQAAPLRDESTAIMGLVITFQDITAVKEVERLKDEFISVASHELRQPLTVIQGQAQLLDRHLRRHTSGAAPLNLEVLGQIAEGIESQTVRLNLLVSDLLDMSRIQSGELRLDVAPTTLLEVLDHLIGLQRSTTLDHQFVLDVCLSEGMRDLKGEWDRRRIEQIVLNLLSNAIKYSPDGGEVRIAVEFLPEGRSIEPQHARRPKAIAGPAAHIVVRDHGIGIPHEAMPNLFERFYRAGNTVGIQGTGLGLYICRQLALAHHGDLWAESAGIGEGSAFHLVLPVQHV